MHVNFGLVPPLPERVRGKRERYAAYAERARGDMARWVASREDLFGPRTPTAMELTVTDAAPTPEALVDRFLAHLRVERAASPQTVRAYSADLQRYLEWAERTGVDPITLTHRQMRLYLGEMDRAGYARRTIARRLSAVRSLFAYLVAEGLVASDPSSVLATPKLPSRLPRAIPDDELAALLAAPDPTTAVGLRDRAVLELLYATGARVSEVVGLELSDVDFAQGQVRLYGKGSKERIVPVYEAALASIRTYLREARPQLAQGTAREPPVSVVPWQRAFGGCCASAL